MVKSVVTGYAPGSSLFERAIVETNTVPPNKWRDTIFIPPLGSTTIWQHFGHGRVNAWQGKTVYHCHFLGAPRPSDGGSAHADALMP